MKKWSLLIIVIIIHNSLKGMTRWWEENTLLLHQTTIRTFMDMKTGCSIISKRAVFLALECCLRADCLISWGWSSITESKVVRVGKMVYVESTANTSASTHNNTGGQVCTLHHYTHHRRGAIQAQSRSSLNPTEVSKKDNGQHLQSALKEKSLERDKRDTLFLGFRSHLKTIQTCEHLHPSERLWARRSWLGMPWWARGFAVWSFSSCVCVGWGAADLSRQNIYVCLHRRISICFQYSLSWGASLVCQRHPIPLIQDKLAWPLEARTSDPTPWYPLRQPQVSQSCSPGSCRPELSSKSCG